MAAWTSINVWYEFKSISLFLSINRLNLIQIIIHLNQISQHIFGYAV